MKLGNAIEVTYISINQSICFTLYPAHCRVGRGNLVLRLCSSLSAEYRHCVLSGRTQRRVLTFHLRKIFLINLKISI